MPGSGRFYGPADAISGDYGASRSADHARQARSRWLALSRARRHSARGRLGEVSRVSIATISRWLSISTRYVPPQFSCRRMMGAVTERPAHQSTVGSVLRHQLQAFNAGVCRRRLIGDALGVDVSFTTLGFDAQSRRFDGRSLDERRYATISAADDGCRGRR